MRYFLQIAYQGTRFHGWQIQNNARTIQEELEKALEVLLKERIETLGCGRTDGGVHAKDFYLHFDLDRTLDQDKIVYQLNGMLDEAIVCYQLIPVKSEAHARFDATARTYEYLVHTYKNPFLKNASMYFPYPLDLDLMNEAASWLMTQKDFASFCKAGSDNKTTLCDLMFMKWTCSGAEYRLEIKANRFLRNMVRAVVGTSLDLGRNRISLEEFKDIVRSQDRKKAGPSADACGLYLLKIDYPFL